MDMYHDTIALASAKVFAEFEHLLNQHPDKRAAACAQIIEQTTELLNKDKPLNAREWSEKTIRSSVSQFLISRGHSPKELADAEANAQKSTRGLGPCTLAEFGLTTISRPFN
jgi:hypothetical protein